MRLICGFQVRHGTQQEIMLEKHIHLLIKHRVEIVDDLLVDDVLPFLRSKFVLDNEDVDLIRAEQTSRRKAEKLIDILPSKGFEAFTVFFDSLVDKYPHLAKILLEGVSEDKHAEIFDQIDSPLQCKY